MDLSATAQELDMVVLLHGLLIDDIYSGRLCDRGGKIYQQDHGSEN
jgi:hypothetical protein